MLCNRDWHFLCKKSGITKPCGINRCRRAFYLELLAFKKMLVDAPTLSDPARHKNFLSRIPFNERLREGRGLFAPKNADRNDLAVCYCTGFGTELGAFFGGNLAGKRRIGRFCTFFSSNRDARGNIDCRHGENTNATCQRKPFPAENRRKFLCADPFACAPGRATGSFRGCAGKIH